MDPMDPTTTPLPRNVYAGIFADEPGQQLLNHSMAQLASTLGTAWTACEAKEDRLDVFQRCMDLVDTWNDKTFAEEAEAVFAAQPRSSECWRAAFSGYVRQVYRSSNVQVRATVPNKTAYVQTLLTVAAKHPTFRSGHYFEVESPLDKKDVAMDVVRQAMAVLCDEFVYEQAAASVVDEATPADAITPDDSASQVGVQAYRAAHGDGGRPKAHSAASGDSNATSEASEPAPPRRSEVPEHKSVTIMTSHHAKRRAASERSASEVEHEEASHASHASHGSHLRSES